MERTFRFKNNIGLVKIVIAPDGRVELTLHSLKSGGFFFHSPGLPTGIATRK